jgi:hypothetical protein
MAVNKPVGDMFRTSLAAHQLGRAHQEGLLCGGEKAGQEENGRQEIKGRAPPEGGKPVMTGPDFEFDRDEDDVVIYIAIAFCLGNAALRADPGSLDPGTMS